MNWKSAITALPAVILTSPFILMPKSQRFGPVVFSGPVNKKTVALSFDDGPNDPYTSEILDLLKHHNVSATFFLLGKQAAENPVTVKRIAQEGHAIGNHSYNHSLLEPFRNPAFADQLKLTQDILFKITGQMPRLFRPPWFFRNPSMIKTATSLGLTAITGTFASNFEVLQISSDEIVDSVIRRVRPGIIFCFHDGAEGRQEYRGKTVEAVSRIIPKLKNLGYEFVTITKMLER